MSCNAYSEVKKPNLEYEFWKNKEGIKVQACLCDYNTKEVLWLLPSAVEQNKYSKSFKIIDDTKRNVTPKYDYIETNSNSNKTCISYTLEKNKGWYNQWSNQYFQDISEDSFLLFGNHSLIIPESVFEEFENIDVKFRWNNFQKSIYSGLSDVKHSKYYSLTLKDFDSLFFASGYEVISLDQLSEDKLIYPKNYYSIISKAASQLKDINAFLKEKHLAIKSYRNTFIFVENDYNSPQNPGSAYSNNKDFVQIVGVNHKQKWDRSLIRTFIHEYLHKIIGFTIKFEAKKSSEEWWFKEGFTDFLTMQILLETNIWNIEDYMHYFNDRIYEYYTFEMYKYKLNEMYNKYIYDEAGYIAGMLYASKLNEFIMNNTDNTKGLLDFLSNFATLFIKNENLYFSEDLFFKKLKLFVKKPFPTIEELRETNSLLNQKLLSGKLSLQHKKIKIPNYPCDFYNLATTMQFNNKKIVSIITSSSDSYIHYLKLVDEENKFEEFTLEPLYTDQIIPQYEEI